jgi:hypothetical protein
MASTIQTSQFNIECKAGVDLFLSLSFTDNSGAVINLSGWTFTSRIRRLGSEEVMIQPTLALSNPAAGQLAFRIPASTTYGMKDFVGYYDLLGTRPDAVVVELMKGEFRLVRSASRT